LDDAFGVDDKLPAEYASTFQQDSIVSTHTVALVAKKRDTDSANAAVLPWEVLPLPKTKFRICRNECDSTISLRELINAVVKG